VVEDITAEDAQVCSGGVCEGSKLATHVGNASVVSTQHEDGFQHIELAFAGDSLQDHAPRRRCGGETQLFQEVRREDSAVGTRVDQEYTSFEATIGSLNLDPNGWARDAVVTKTTRP
jgi:hypothetical protein